MGYNQTSRGQRFVALVTTLSSLMSVLAHLPVILRHLYPFGRISGKFRRFAQKNLVIETLCRL